jgi:LDH2 family malate/lactate/ureidoglycolate dehydrogenase
MTSPDTVRVPYRKLLAFTRATFSEHGLPPARAHTAAAALCYADLRGLAPRGLAELTALHLPMLDDGRADPDAEPETLHDTGACALVEARGALGLWAASEAVDSAIDRAQQHGVGLVSVRGGTPFGCAGVHAIRATRDGMIGVVASTGGPASPGPDHPVAAAAPALDQRPFALDLSATMTREDPDFPQPPREDELRWPADLAERPGQPSTAAFAPLLAAMLCGSTGSPFDFAGTGGTDFVALALDPRAICPGHDTIGTARSLFTTFVPQIPTTAGRGGGTRYPGWLEAERAHHALHAGVPLPRPLHEELVSLGLEDAEQVPVPV